MTTADATRTVDPREAQALRRRVRLLLEEEYLRLRAGDRPELLMNAGTIDDGLDPDVLVEELAIIERRVEALGRHLAAAGADPSDPASGQVFLLDLGDGPQLMLLSQLNLADDQVIAADSPLGRALRSAAAGQVVTYQGPRGLRRARVLAVEAGHVVVGLRESAHSADALAMGFAEADRRRADLLVTVIRDPGVAAGDDLDPVFHAPDDVDAEEVDHLARAVADAGGAYPHVRVRFMLRTGHFAEVLLELSDSADLLVLGLGQRPVGMGSKDLLIASHSACPVIVVREPLIRGGN